VSGNLFANRASQVRNNSVATSTSKMGLSGVKSGVNKDSPLTLSRKQMKVIKRSKFFYNTLDLSARKKSEQNEQNSRDKSKSIESKQESIKNRKQLIKALSYSELQVANLGKNQ
jgi:hypothetical protein